MASSPTIKVEIEGLDELGKVVASVKELVSSLRDALLEDTEDSNTLESEPDAPTLAAWSENDVVRTETNPEVERVVQIWTRNEAGEWHSNHPNQSCILTDSEIEDNLLDSPYAEWTVLYQHSLGVRVKRTDELSMKPAIALFLLGLAQVALGRALRR